MYIAIIYGWYEVMAFAKTEKEAQNLAIAKKKAKCPDEPIDSWDWKRVSEYFGAESTKITNGLVIDR